VLLALAGAACASAPRDPGPPRMIPGWVAPPQGDSLIREGPLAGRAIYLVCAPNLGTLETNDEARCHLNTGLTEGSITTFALLDSFPQLHVSNPRVAAAPRTGRVIARDTGYSALWATYSGARAIEWLSVEPVQGEVRFVPGVTDTTIEVGQRYRFRLVHYDAMGREQLNPRGAAMTVAWWGRGRIDTVGLNLFELTATETGRAELTMFRGKRSAQVTVRFVAPKKVEASPAPSAPRDLRTTRQLTASIQIQVIDSVASPRPMPLSIGGKIVRTDRDGWYRARADTGTFKVTVHCLAEDRPTGEALRDTTLRFVAGQNPRVRIRFSSARCVRPR
jgi:hypothetical protein